MNDKPNDTLITLFPTLIMKCSDFLSKSEIDEIFEILKSKPKEQHDTLAIGGKSSHGMGMSNDLISSLGLESRIQKKLDMYTNSLKLQKVAIDNSWFNIQDIGSILKLHMHTRSPVSYTHLTLPTILLV